jgi:hypothetical protein
MTDILTKIQIDASSEGTIFGLKHASDNSYFYYTFTREMLIKIANSYCFLSIGQLGKTSQTLEDIKYRKFFKPPFIASFIGAFEGYFRIPKEMLPIGFYDAYCGAYDRASYLSNPFYNEFLNFKPEKCFENLYDSAFNAAKLFFEVKFNCVDVYTQQDAIVNKCVEDLFV